MATREIPRERWKSFLDQFSEEHRGWRVKVEVAGDGGAQEEARGLPLLGISADWKGSDAPAVEVMVGETPDDHVTHIVEAPARISFRETEDGVHEGLEIASAGGGSTIIRFQPPRRPSEPHRM